MHKLINPPATNTSNLFLSIILPMNVQIIQLEVYPRELIESSEHHEMPAALDMFEDS